MPTKKKPEPKAAAPKRAATKAAAPKAAAPKAATPDAEPVPAPLNREQRRAQKFGKAGKVHQHDPIGTWPESGANPALGASGPVAGADQAAHAGGPDQDVSHEIGAGSGGATEEPDTRPQHEGARAGNTTKS